jgi:hypothetical protein
MINWIHKYRDNLRQLIPVLCRPASAARIYLDRTICFILGKNNMETKEKQKTAAKINRAFTESMASLGFQRTKTSFWTRINGPTVQLIHLHLFSFTSAYRVHLGIRILNDDFDAVALNGLSSQDGWFKPKDRYLFEFNESDLSIDQCVKSLSRFCEEIAEPWFSQFSDPINLILNAKSPLNKG